MKRIQPPRLDRVYYALSELPELLSISLNELIEQAIQGNLELIVRVPLNTVVWSVHPDAIDIASPLHRYKLLTGGAKPVNPDETYPVSMESSEITGLVLTPADCFTLRRQGFLAATTFAAAVNSKGVWASEVFPIARNALYKQKNHDVSGWALACYPSNVSIIFQPGLGFPRPFEIDVTFDRTWATRNTLDNFLHAIHHGDIVDEFFIRDQESGAFLGINEEAIQVVSDRLRYLLEAAALCWAPRSASSSKKEISDSRDAIRNQLKNEDFVELFDGDEVSKGLLDAACGFAAPLFTTRNASEDDKAAYPTFVTPRLVTLVIAWKIYWGGANVDPAKPETCPVRDSEVKFLRSLGFAGNTAKYAATLLRPSAARKGRPVQPKRWKRPVIVKHKR